MRKKNHFFSTYSICMCFAILFVLGCKPNKKTVDSFAKEALSQTLLATNGKQVLFDSIIKQNQGKAVLIEIWASWCGDCVAAMPKIKKIQEKYPNLNYVFISMDKTPEDWQNGIEKHQLKGQHFMANDQMDGVFAKTIDLDWIPRYLILDQFGKIIVYNAIETDFDFIEKKLNELK